MSSISEPFIRRPVGMTLLTIALALAGGLAYFFLPVAPLPETDNPTISVSANLPGASPETMASAVATPLERQFGRIAGVTEMTSSSYLGSTSITLQFDLNRNIDAAARDVQAAINASAGQLPSNLPSLPTYRKVNPADAPILILALTSDIYDRAKMYDVASSILSQKLSQVDGVGQVTVGGGALPAVRVDVNPTAIHNMGLGLEDIRPVLANANANRPKGQVANDLHAWSVNATDQLFTAREYQPLIVAYRNGLPVRLRDVATVTDSVEDTRTAGLFDGKPAIAIIIFRQPGANIIATVDRVRAADSATPGLDPAGDSPGRDGRPQHDHPRLRQRHRADAGDLDLAGGHGRLHLPARLAVDADPRRRRARLADRHVRRDVPGGLQHRQPFPDGDDHRHRLCRRRRHRRHREHHPLPGTGAFAPRCGAARGQGDRLYRALHQRLAGGGVHPDPHDGRTGRDGSFASSPWCCRWPSCSR